MPLLKDKNIENLPSLMPFDDLSRLSVIKNNRNNMQ